MSARVVLAMAAALAAGSALAADEKQSATRVSGGGSSDSSRSTATRSSSGSSDHSTATRSSSERSSDRSHATRSSDRSDRSSATRSSSSRSSSARTPETDAQRRHPRPGTGTGRFHFDNDGRGRGFGWGYGYGYGYGYGGRYGRSGRYGYYYNPYDYWYSPYYYSGYYGYSPSYYRRGRGYGYYRDSGSVRIIVDPEKTRVYVDGYYAGIVDDFDGILQRLNVPPGRHDITLKLEGYRTQHFKVYVPVDDTIKIHYNMVRGSGEATSEEFAGDPDADYARVRDMSDDDRGRDDRYRRGRDDDDDYDRGDFRAQGDTGSVRLSVSPRDASVYVDGEFRGSGRDSSSLRLRPGRHRIEVVRPGYRTIEREIEVESGRSTSIEFDLERM